MYQIYGIAKCLSIYALLCCVSVVLYIFYLSPIDTIALEVLWKAIKRIVSFWGVALAVIGYPTVFEALCRYTPLKYIFPDISGVWIAELHSNWPKIAERLGMTSQNTGPTMAKIRIVSSLFFIKVYLCSDTKYSDSETITATIKKENGKIRLYYIYDNLTNNPLETDSERHYGAAYLDLDMEDKTNPEFSGAYWTNRNWSKAMNTAGALYLKRAVAES